MKNYKRLFSLIKCKLHWFFISLLMVILIQGLAFISPLLVKVVLDDYILGIEYEWNEVVESDDFTVKFNDKYYKQTRYLDEDDIVIGNASIILYKDGFYFVDISIENINKEIKEENGKYYIFSTDETSNQLLYECTKLNKDQVFNFYEPVIPYLIQFIIIIFIKTLVTILCGFIQAFSINKVLIIDFSCSEHSAYTGLERILFLLI